MKIKRPKTKQGNRISAQAPPNYDDKPPIFSLEKLQEGKHCLSKLVQEQKAAFADAIFRRKNLTWREIRNISRQGLGTERLPKNAIKAPIPPFITDETSTLLVFRFGDNRMVGYRVHDVFYVLWFDYDFSLYDHGS